MGKGEKLDEKCRDLKAFYCVIMGSCDGINIRSGP